MRKPGASRALQLIGRITGGDHEPSSTCGCPRRLQAVSVRGAGRALLARTGPRDVVGKTRRRLAAELITELEGIDRKIKACEKEITVLVEARGSTLLQLHGIGPSRAARLLADVGNTHRLASRDHFASWNGDGALEREVAHAHDGRAVATCHRLQRRVDRGSVQLSEPHRADDHQDGSSTSLFLRTVLADRPSSPLASQSSAALRTVYLPPCTGQKASVSTVNSTRITRIR
jgi:hypothetical protein